MSSNVKEIIKARNELVTRTANEVKRKINALPDGRINIKHIKHSTYYYHAEKENGEKILSDNDADMIGKLIQKSYLEKVLKSLQAEKSVLEKTIKHYPETIAEDIYDQLSEERKMIAKPIVLSDEEYARRWQEKPYVKKPISDDIPVYTTMRGERVRSKSEIIIADRLLANGIPYKYECPLKVGKEIIHPDFTILRMSDRKILYHEHCGRADDSGYAEDMVKRINDYSEEGIIQGDRLFLSFETSEQPLDVRVIDRLINSHFR